MVTVELPAALMRYADAEIQRLDGATIGAVFERLWERCPDLRSRVISSRGTVHPYLLVMHGDRRVPHDRFADWPVADGDRLEIVALAEGG